MIIYQNKVVKALETVLPIHYEMVLTSKTKTPCLSYMELNNYSITEPLGNNRGYSRITFQVKIWSNRVADFEIYAPEVDRVMREQGFKRISSGELYDNNSTMAQKILTYEALALEEFN